MDLIVPPSQHTKNLRYSALCYIEAGIQLDVSIMMTLSLSCRLKRKQRKLEKKTSSKDGASEEEDGAKGEVGGAKGEDMPEEEVGGAGSSGGEEEEPHFVIGGR
jgi:hypothetical protein